MERISMSKIDKEIEILSEQLKDLLDAKTTIFHILDIVLVEGRDIHEDLDEISVYKYRRTVVYYLQSKVYDTVVYLLDYDYDLKVCYLKIKFKPCKLVFVSDREYKLSICESEGLYIQWRGQKTRKISSHVYSLRYELCLPCKLSLEDDYIKNILNPPKTQQGLVEEVSIHLG